MEQYLAQHIRKSFTNKSTLLDKTVVCKGERNLRRRMSVKGAIKKTRSINVDCKYLLKFQI